MLNVLIFARRGNEAANQWLAQHPMVLGLVFLLLGLLVGGWGLFELLSGVAHTKRGKTLSGGQAKAMAIIRIVAGAGCILFALYKLIAG